MPWSIGSTAAGLDPLCAGTSRAQGDERGHQPSSRHPTFRTTWKVTTPSADDLGDAVDVVARQLSLSAGRRPILLPSQVRGSYFLSTTRSLSGMSALSVMRMPSGHTSVQHLVMLQ
jgi:hypothetical protein